MQKVIFIGLFVIAVWFVQEFRFVQLHEDAHLVTARDAGLEAKQVARNRVEWRGNPTERQRAYILIAGYRSTALLTGCLLGVAWMIAWALPVNGWLGLFAGAFHSSLFLPMGSSDFSKLDQASINGWIMSAVICVLFFWVGFYLQSITKGAKHENHIR